MQTSCDKHCDFVVVYTTEECPVCEIIYHSDECRDRLKYRDLDISYLEEEIRELNKQIETLKDEMYYTK